MDVRLKKGDIVILVIAVLVSGIAIWLTLIKEEGDKVIVTANGEKQEYSLSKNQEITLKTDAGGYNTLVIKNHQVEMEGASCPDQICVKHKAIYKNGETIICLPNEVFVEVESSEEKDVDN
jgi:hypothetical protein